MYEIYVGEKYLYSCGQDHEARARNIHHVNPKHLQILLTAPQPCFTHKEEADVEFLQQGVSC